MKTTEFLGKLYTRHRITTEIELDKETKKYRVEMVDIDTDTTIAVIKAETMDEAVENILFKFVTDVRDRKVPSGGNKLTEL